jgi:Uma2 family endonuclease
MVAKTARVTVDALETLDDERVEVIDGELVRDAAPTFEHGDAQASLVSEIKSRFRGGGPPSAGGGWWLATEVTVVYEPHQGFIHDLAGWRKDRTPTRPRGPRVTTRPDWVCEILSTNKRKDLVDKRAVLHAHGVPHYWIMDLDAMRLTVLRWHVDGYLVAAEALPGERTRLEPFEAVELEVSRLFGDIDAGVPSP